MKEAEVVSIDDLIAVVADGGAVRTGMNFYNEQNDLLLEKDVLITRTSTLLRLKELGHTTLPFDRNKEGVVWDKNGKKVEIHIVTGPEEREVEPVQGAPLRVSTLGSRIKEIRSIRQEAEKLQTRARENVQEALNQIQRNGGKFDAEMVTGVVEETVDFLKSNEEAPLHMAREIFAFDKYIYNHSVNVCTFGVAILHSFNSQFSQVINGNLASFSEFENLQGNSESLAQFVLYQEEEIKEIALGYMLHDCGKSLIPTRILNKQTPLDADEFRQIQAHSYGLGAEILRRNHITSAVIGNIVGFHHAALFPGEERTYPDSRNPQQIPFYVKICKLADMYDAMTSRRSYSNARNPISAITDIVRLYSAHKEKCLQLILAAFVKTIGVYPPGSVVFLRSGQMAYVLKPRGPVIIPFTDSFLNPLTRLPDPIDLSLARFQEATMQIDRRKPLPDPIAYHHLLPAVLQ